MYVKVSPLNLNAIVNPIYGCGVKITTDFNPVYVCWVGKVLSKRFHKCIICLLTWDLKIVGGGRALGLTMYIVYEHWLIFLENVVSDN